MNNLTLIIPAKKEKESLSKVLDELEPYNIKTIVVLEREDIETIETTKSGSTYPDTSTDGFIAGFGYEHQAGNGFGIRIEIVGHEFDNVKVDNGQGTGGNLNIIEVTEMYGATASLAVVKSF